MNADTDWYPLVMEEQSNNQQPWLARALLVGDRAPEERAMIPVVVVLLPVGWALADISGLVVALVVAAAVSMAWADWAQTKAGYPWAPCECRRLRPYQMTKGMARRRYRTAVILLLLAGLAGWTVGIVWGVLLGWSAIATAAAVPLRYGGCPELGLLASMLRGRLSRSGCGPWCLADKHGGDLLQEVPATEEHSN